MAFKAVTKTGARLPIYNERFLTELLRVLASGYEISRRTLNNITRLITMSDRNWYARDYKVGALMEAIMLVMESRLDGTFDSLDDATVQNMVLAKVEASVPALYNEAKEDIIIPTVRIWKCRESQASFVFKQVELNVKHGGVLGQAPDLADILTDLTSGNVSNLEKTLAEFRLKIDELNDAFKLTDNSAKTKAIVHTQDPDYVETHLKDLFKRMKSPKSNLKLGVKMFNEFLSIAGGLVNGKLYMIYADVNSFKSALLLHITRWIQQYNGHLFLNVAETKKIPTVLHIQLENTASEDADRMYKIKTRKNLGDSHDFEEIRHTWNGSFNDSSIDISFYHDTSDTIKVSDIENMIDALDDDGFEVIAVIVDYIELLRSDDEDRRKEVHEKLPIIADKLHALAGRKNIPIVTAMQLNRNGQLEKAAAKAAGKKNLVKLQNRGFIANASGIERKVDFSWFIDIEADEDPMTREKKFYLTLFRSKHRYRVTDRDYFVHEIKNGIILEDDVGIDGYLSLPEIPTKFSTSSDEYTFTGAKEGGSRGQTSVREKTKAPEQMVTTKPSWIQSIDDKSIESLYVCALASLGLFADQSTFTFNDDEIVNVDGQNFVFGRTFVDAGGYIHEE